jgi:hypothetical protein
MLGVKMEKIDDVSDFKSWDFRNLVMFKDIDRDEEDRDITIFQKTQDLILQEKIYNRRISTIQHWAREYAQKTHNDFEDMFNDFSIKFIFLLRGYKKSRGSFNTYLYSSYLNLIRNFFNSKRANKRRPIGLDPNIHNFVYSLEHPYKHGDQEGGTLQDFISDQIITKDCINKDINLKETISVLSNNNPSMKTFLVKICSGNSVASAIKEMKKRHGGIKISGQLSRKINKGKCVKRIVKKIISDDVNDDFKLLNYQVQQGNQLVYTIEMRKTKDTDYVSKMLRKMKNNKEKILEKMAG